MTSTGTTLHEMSAPYSVDAMYDVADYSSAADAPDYCDNSDYFYNWCTADSCGVCSDGWARADYPTCEANGWWDDTDGSGREPKTTGSTTGPLSLVWWFTGVGRGRSRKYKSVSAMRALR